MKIISFAWTTGALLSGAKSVTRRRLQLRLARQFKAGDLVQAWDKVPYAGGKRIGTIRLTRDPYWQAWREMPDAEYGREGFAWMSEHYPNALSGAALKVPITWDEFKHWRDRDGGCFVVEFELVDVLGE